MKSLADCEFTAFISYAHADDVAWFDWVTQFRSELERSLAALLRGVRLPRFHLSGDNGPVAGELSDELTRRIEASFAMIIIVHDNYAQSAWCLKELEYFKSLFGEEGFRQRLYIVAMSESAILRVSASPAWQRLVPGGGQLWMPFYDAADPGRPLDIYLAPGLVAPAFRTPFERLRSDFAAKLRLAAASPASAPAPTPPAGPPPASLSAGPASAAAVAADAGRLGRGVLLGVVPQALAPAAAAAAAELQRRGVPVRQLPPEALMGDFADFASADHLVLAFDDTPPMLGALAAGGHLQLQREAWLQRGRPLQGLHWLDLRPDPPPQAAWQGAAAYVAHSGARPESLAAIAAQAVPPPAAAPAPAAAAARVYIESNRYERTLWEPLGEQIRRRWDRLCELEAPGRVPPLCLRARGLPVDQIDNYPNLDDADGVVLLWGRKTSDALVAQINKVENKMAPGRDAPPGIVAYLMPPQQASEPVPAWGWQVLRFTAAEPGAIAVVDEESDDLEQFLRKVFQRRQQRDGAGPP